MAGKGGTRRDSSFLAWIARRTRDHAFLYLIAAAAGVCAAVSLMLLGGLAGLVLSGVVALIAYGILMWVFEREQIARSWRLLRGDISLEAA